MCSRTSIYRVACTSTHSRSAHKGLNVFKLPPWECLSQFVEKMWRAVSGTLHVGKAVSVFVRRLRLAAVWVSRSPLVSSPLVSHPVSRRCPDPVLTSARHSSQPAILPQCRTFQRLSTVLHVNFPSAHPLKVRRHFCPRFLSVESIGFLLRTCMGDC